MVRLKNRTLDIAFTEQALIDLLKFYFLILFFALSESVV